MKNTIIRKLFVVLLAVVIIATMVFPIVAANATPTLTHKAFIGGSYLGNGTFVRPRGLSFANGKLYVADTHAQTIQIFDGAGTYIGEFGHPCPDIPGYNNDVLDVAVGQDGKIYVPDIDNIVEVYNADYSHVIRVGKVNKYVNNGTFESWVSENLPYGFNSGYSETTTGIYRRADWKTSGDYSVGMAPRSGYVELTQEISEQVRAGVNYTASIKVISDYSDLSKIKLFMMFLDEDGDQLSVTHAQGNTAGICSYEMRNMSVSATSPAGTAVIKIWVRTEAAASGTVAWDDLVVNETGWSNVFNYPRAVSVDTNGSMYVTDTYNHQILVFDSNYTYSQTIGSSGTGNGQFRNPYDIIVTDSGNKYIADFSNNRIQVLDANNNFVRNIGSYGSGNGALTSPSAIAVDEEDGRIYVTDTGNHRIQCFSLAGEFLWGIGSGVAWNANTAAPQPTSGSQARYFNSPEGITVDTVNDVLYVADTFNDRICIIDIAEFETSYFGGSRQLQNGKLLRASGMDVDSNGNIYVTDIFNSAVQVFDTNGDHLRNIGSFGTAAGYLNYPSEVYIGTDEKVYVVDSFNNRVSIFNTDGSIDTNWWKIGTGNYGTGNGDMMNPMYITQDTYNRFLVAEWDSTYYSTTKRGRVQIFNSDGTYYGSMYVPQASGMAVDSKTGQIYVCSASESKVYVFNKDYELERTFGQTGRGSSPDFFFAPLDIEIDDNLNIYIADYRNNRVVMYDKNWEYITSFGTFGTGNDNLIYPDALLFHNNLLYVAEWCNDRVNVLSMDYGAEFFNGSFESWGDGSRPTQWNLGYSNVSYGTGISASNQHTKSGQLSLRMEATPANSYVEATQMLTLDVQTMYEIGVWVYSDNAIGNKCQAHVVFYDDTGAVVGTTSTNGATEGISAGQWSQMTLSIQPPQNSVNAKVYLRMMGGDSVCVYWDDITISPIS